MIKYGDCIWKDWGIAGKEISREVVDKPQVRSDSGLHLRQWSGSDTGNGGELTDLGEWIWRFREVKVQRGDVMTNYLCTFELDNRADSDVFHGTENFKKPNQNEGSGGGSCKSYQRL